MRYFASELYHAGWLCISDMLVNLCDIRSRVLYKLTIGLVGIGPQTFISCGER